MSVAVQPPTARPDGITFRLATEADLPTCAEIWRRSIDDYIGRLGQAPLPTENASLVRLYAHLHATDPGRFVVAVRSADAQSDGTQSDGMQPDVVAFTSAVRRDHLWFLSMLFVLPELQGLGLGRDLLARIRPSDPEVMQATATDSAQPISNALYAALGLVPRVPLLDLIGNPTDRGAFGDLPSGLTPVRFEDVVARNDGSGGHAALADAINDLDRATLGVAHPQDHRYLRTEGRTGWLYLGPDGGPQGYGYATEAGRVGPVAVRDTALIAPILGHLTGAIVPRGAFAMWLPGSAGEAVTAALRSGMRLEPFPILLCWDRSFGAFERYLPISPGLL